MSMANTAVICARVDQRIKEELDNYLRVTGTTLTTAICDLIERGLVSV
jgi:antitoxin component of RelBE/YafQ-DinJ toxin-antitoxin module